MMVCTGVPPQPLRRSISPPPLAADCLPRPLLGRYVYCLIPFAAQRPVGHFGCEGGEVVIDPPLFAGPTGETCFAAPLNELCAFGPPIELCAFGPPIELCAKAG